MGATDISRREALAALAATASLPLLLSACSRESSSMSSDTTDADARALLERLAGRLLRLSPESATSLGVDTGARAALRSQLTDRSAEGQRRIADQLRGAPSVRQSALCGLGGRGRKGIPSTERAELYDLLFRAAAETRQQSRRIRSAWAVTSAG